MDVTPLGKLLLIVGLVLAGLGLLVMLAGKGLIPRLPGDFSFNIGSVRVYLPLVTSIVLSILLTLALRLFSGR